MIQRLYRQVLSLLQHILYLIGPLITRPEKSNTSQPSVTFISEEDNGNLVRPSKLTVQNIPATSNQD